MNSDNPPSFRDELPTLVEQPVSSTDLAKEWEEKLKQTRKENGE